MCLSTKDALYMQDKKFEICKLCKYSVYDAITESGWNCTNSGSKHFTTGWDLPVADILFCPIFLFAVEGLRKWVKSEIKLVEEKKQTTLGDWIC